MTLRSRSVVTLTAPRFRSSLTSLLARMVTAMTGIFAEFKSSVRVCASFTRYVSLLLPSISVPEQRMILVFEQDAYWCCQSRRQQTRSSSPCFHEGEHGGTHPPLQSMFHLSIQYISLTYRHDSSSVRVTPYLQARPTALSKHPRARWESTLYRAFSPSTTPSSMRPTSWVRAGMAQTARTGVKSVPPGSLTWQAQTS